MTGCPSPRPECNLCRSLLQILPFQALYAKSKEHADFGKIGNDGEESDESAGETKPGVAHTGLNKMLEKWEEAEETPRDQPSPSKRKQGAAAEDEPSPKKVRPTLLILGQ